MNHLLAIRAFVRVAESGSFTRAADHLGMPRSTVSKLVADLEQHLGVKLMQRTTRKAVVTPEGADYYASVMPIVLDLDETEERVRGKRLTPRGRLRVDVPSSFAKHFLIDRLPDFRRRYPELQLELGMSDRTIDIVGEGVDCAIRVGELRDTSLIARRLFTATTALAASPSYLAHKGRPLTAEDLRQGHDLVGYFFAATSRTVPIQLEKDGVKTQLAQFAILANESSGHIDMMAAGLGIGQSILPMMQPFINDGRLVTLLDDWLQPSMDYHLIYPANRHQNGRLRAFVDWIVAAAVVN